VNNNEQPLRQRLRGTKVRKGEVLRDSRGRTVDNAYVDRAVKDALVKAAERPRKK
jgi:hypothetical protein